MEHEDAIQLHAAERYVTHRLSAAERDAFEEHFFDCPECAEEVRWEQIFVANGRAAALQPPAKLHPQPVPVPSPRGWRAKWSGVLAWRPALPLSLAVNFALAAVLVFVLVIPGRQPAPTLWTQEYFAPGPAHGDEDIHILTAGTPVYQVHFSSLGTPSYSYEVLDRNGRRELSGSLEAPPGQVVNLRLTVAVGSLPPGDHTLIVHGLPAGEIASRSRFQTSH
jgi:hypothetical protein